MKRGRKLIAFDMDGTLLEGRLIYNLAKKFGFERKLSEIQKNTNLHGYQKTKEIAIMLKGIHKDKIIQTMKDIRTIRNWRKTIEELKMQGHVLGIISDSYTLACDYLANKMNLDFVVANKLEVDENGNLTGQIFMPLGWEKIGCNCKISVCKRYHLEKMAERFGIPISDTSVVGDTISDLCMIQRAGVGIALMPKDKILEEKSDIVITVPDLSKIVPFILG